MEIINGTLICFFFCVDKGCIGNSEIGTGREKKDNFMKKKRGVMNSDVECVGNFFSKMES